MHPFTTDRVTGYVIFIFLLCTLFGACSRSEIYDPTLKKNPVLSPHQLRDGRVLFSFHSASLHPQSVAIAGDFTKNNQPAGPFPLSDKNGDGIYRGAIRLDPGQYMYRFLIDGKYLIDPIRVQESPVSGYSGSLQVYPATTPRLLSTIPAAYSRVAALSNVQFRLGGDLGSFDPKSLRIVINQKGCTPKYDTTSGIGSFSLPIGTKGRVDFSVRALNTEGMEVLNDSTTIYIAPKTRTTPPLPASATAYRVLVPFFGPETRPGQGTINNLIEKLDYLNDGKKEGTSLGITHLFLHALYPAADPYRMAAIRYTGFGRGGSRYSLNRLLAACKKRGIKVILHFNAGYCSNTHHWFQNAFGNLASKRMRWFHFLDSRHTRYSGFMGRQALPLLRVAENDQAKAFFLNTLWDWIKTGIDGFFFEHAALQDDDFWKNKVAASIMKYKKNFILARDGRPPLGRMHHLLQGAANVLQAPHFSQHLLLTTRHGDIRKLQATFSAYSRSAGNEVYLRPTSQPEAIRPGSLFRRNSFREALLGVALTGAGVPVIQYGDELGIPSPPYPNHLEPGQMPWNSLVSERKKPAGIFNLTRAIIRLRKESVLFRRNRINDRPLVFHDNENDEPNCITVRWKGGTDFFAVVFNPTGINSVISREIRIEGFPDGEYTGREILTPGEKGVDAEAADGVLSINNCPTQGRGYLVYRFTLMRKKP